MLYLDTSCLAKIYLDEPGAGAFVAWLAGKTGLVCAHHGRLELVAALKRNHRESRITAAELRDLLRQLADDERSGLIRWLPLGASLIESACQQTAALPPSVFIRAGDALHLACAGDAGLKEIYSHDRHLLAAAPHFGLKGRDVITGA